MNIALSRSNMVYNECKVSERVDYLLELIDDNDLELKFVKNDENYKGRIDLKNGIIILNVNYVDEMAQTTLHEAIHYDNSRNRSIRPNYEEEVGTEYETNLLAENPNNLSCVYKYLIKRKEVKKHPGLRKTLEYLSDHPEDDD